jgi:ABC-type polysaccharide/polyol phosphate transport system ATPase subunit
MYVRLGFSAATDVQPEILIVDEVLAVGDAEFRKKSAERIENFRKNSTTILMVSHNLGAVQRMGERAA